MVILKVLNISLPDTKLILDVPPVILAMIVVGLVVALHFATEPKTSHVGAMSDSSVRKAQASEPVRPKFIRLLLVVAGFVSATVGIMAVMSPSVLDKVMLLVRG
ncbi:MAG: hypothetical protein RL186_222 [Pseudomonadota bacterium]